MGTTTSSADVYLYRFRVTRRVKGAIGKVVTVASAADGAACGPEVQVGKKYAFLLDRRQGRWWTTLCQQRPATFFRGIAWRTLATSAGCG